MLTLVIVSIAWFLTGYGVGYADASRRATRFFTKVTDDLIRKANQRVTEADQRCNQIVQAMKEEHATHLRYLGAQRGEQ